jgi:hypothetical protein
VDRPAEPADVRRARVFVASSLFFVIFAISANRSLTD